MEKIHQENLKLISENNICVGDIFELVVEYNGIKSGMKFKINHIHNLYGWILFEETTQLPQEVFKLLNIGKFLKKEKKVSEYTDEELINLSSEEFIRFVEQSDKELIETLDFIEKNNKEIDNIENKLKQMKVGEVEK